MALALSDLETSLSLVLLFSNKHHRPSLFYCIILLHQHKSDYHHNLSTYNNELSSITMASSPTLTPNSLGTSDNFVNLDNMNDSEWEESFSWVMDGMVPIWQNMVYNLLARQWEEILAQRAQDGMEWEYDEEYESGEWIIEEVAQMVSVRERTEH
jgi:hypothetical protein